MKQQNGKGTTVHYGLVDFQKRLERLKERRQEEDQRQPAGDFISSPSTTCIVNDVKRTNVKMERAPVEPMIVNHLTAIDELEHDGFDGR